MNGSGVRRGLASRYATVFAYAGLISSLVGIILASPSLIFPFRPEEADLWWRILVPAALLGLPGFAAWRQFAPKGAPTLSASEAAAVVVLVWVTSVAAGTIAFLLLTDLSVLQALFEATSAFTTTGLSVVDVTAASGVVLLLRSTLEFAGGAGLAILMVSLLGGPLGAGLSSAEGRSEQLVPNVVYSAKLVVRIYVAYAAAGWLALRLAGMGWFDALNHSMAAVSTGGFSTRPESIGYWDSPLIESVTIALMLLGTTNFLVAWSVAKGRWRAATGSGEYRLMAVLMPLSWIALVAVGVGGLYSGMGKTARVILFETVSALSTTGFSTVPYDGWPMAGWLVLVGFMIIGGGAGSTAGGLKQARVYILWRAAWFEITRALLPRRAVNRPLIQSGHRKVFLNDEQVSRAGAYFFVYVAILAFGIFVMVANGVPLAAALFEMASTLGTVGLSVGVTAPDAPAAVLGTQVAAMILGRLEFFVILVGLQRYITDGAHVLRNFIR